jgi:gliding motility-associated-like protein
MYLGNKRSILILLYCFTFLVFKAQTLYWVGGSGNFNDGNHWSLTSGGLSANQIPTSLNDVVFDDNSAIFGNTLIHFVGNNYCKSFYATSINNKIIFNGSSFTKLTIGGNYSLNEKVENYANTSLILLSETNAVNQFNPVSTKIRGNVVFKKGNWNLSSFEIEQPYSLSFEAGSIYLNNSQIRAFDIEAKVNTVKLYSTKSVLISDNKLLLTKVDNITNDLKVIAKISDTSLVKINDPLGKITEQSLSLFACSITYSFTNPSCFGGNDGAISVTVAPGCAPGPFTLNFNTAATCISAVIGSNSVSLAGPTVYTLGGLTGCGGNAVDISLDQGFVTLASITNTSLPQNPTPINIQLLASVQPSCAGQCNGSQVIKITGGTGPYTVQVNPVIPGPTFTIGAATNTLITGLCGGVQTYSITDSKGCVVTPTLLVPNTPPISIAAITKSVTCNGLCNGSYSISATGGTPNFTINFSTGTNSFVASAVTASIGGLCIGAVSATITDSKGCTANTNTTIVQPAVLSVIKTQTLINCGGTCTGAASVAVSGGTSPYTYVWSPGPGNSAGITNLCAGVYTVTILDAQSCTIAPQTFSFNPPPAITITPTFTNVSCNGLTNGTASASVTGGTPGYTVAWVAAGPSTIAANSTTVNNLGPGSYTISVTDAIGCFTTAVITISQPPALTITAVSQSITCFGSCNGGATVTPSGGNGAPFSYTWTPGGQNAASINTLCVGSYTIAVADASNCPTSTVVTITQPASVTPNIISTSVTCNGGNNGTINANPTPIASGPFSYTLASASATVFAAPPFNNLIAGNYTLTIGYGAGCTQTFAIVILQPNPLVPSISSTSITCFNACNGTLAGSALGGTPLYSFVWTTPTGTVAGGALAGQCAGNYAFTVTDANGCTATATTSLVQPTDMTVTINPTNVLCFAGCNGVLSAIISGGTPGYSLVWSNGPTGNPNVGLCAGNYSLTVTDSKGCVKSATSSITAPLAITLTQNTTSTSCAGSCNGSATITAVGGVGPYTFQFNTIPVTTNATGIISGLCAGNYIANVTDANGCSQSINFSIVSPIALSAAITGLQSSCNACTGASTVTASNGTPGYTYVWTNTLAVTVGTNAAVGSLCPGSYTATVTDSKGCTSTATANIVQTVSVTVVTAGGGIQCFGAFTGSATANGLGGTLPYTYSWSPTGPPTQTTQTAVNLGAGSYTVTVTDLLGCSNTGTITFINPPDIIIAATQTNVNCFGNCNGAINSNVSGGTAPLTYSWSPGAITTPNLSGLCVGTYTLKVTDFKGCTKTQIFNISSTPSISATFTTTNPSACIVNNGSICVTASGGPSGGAGPYSYAWSPAGGVGGATSCYSSLLAGPYTVTITDGACSSTVSAVLTNPTGPTLTINSQSVTCFGSSTGAITVTALGTPTFGFVWTPAVGFTTIGNTSTASGLNTGTYNISVTDGNGCVTSQSIGIAQPAASLTIVSTVSNAKCFASCNGSISITPSGGTPGYTYLWTGPGAFTANTQNISGLCQGNYTVNITDSKLCPRQFTFTITQPTALTLTTTASNVLCNAACNGSINVAGGGGTAPVTYTWLPVGTFTGSTNQNIFNLCPNSYTVNASDLNSCQISTVVTITQPIALTTTLTSVNASCSNSCNATASLSVSGGVPTYSFSWSNGPATTPSINGLCAGNYIGTVVDANGCTSVKPFTITAPSAFNVTLSPTNPLCNAVCNGSISTALSGNQGAVNYVWVAAGAGQNPTNLCAGNYTLTATDAAGCIATGVANLVNPPALLANVTSTSPACSGNCNGVAISTPVNAVGIVNYTWTPGPITGTNSINSLCAGNYSVTIKDNNGCTDVQSFTLTNPPVLNVNTSIGPATCGSANGSITVIPIGGTPTYSYTWSAPVVSTSSVVSGLSAGVYTVVVTDFNNCTNTVTIPLSNSNGPSAAPITSSSISCNAQCTGAASINPVGIVGGTPGYTVSWIVPPSASTVNPQTGLCAGTYSAQITDANNCLLFNSVVIAQPAAISVLQNLTFPTCNGVCNGSITLNTSGGTAPYVYAWSPGASLNATLTNACAGNYSITITDSHLCPSTLTLNLPAAQNMTATATVTNNICFGNCLATASVTSISGSPNFPITYSWSNLQTGSIATNLCNGTYTYTATDAIGCFNSFTTNITSPAQITSTNSVASPSCNMCNGSSTITAVGGTGPYTYSWTSSAVGPTATNLCAGLYQVLVTDNNLCTQLQNITISSSSGITGETTTIQNEQCSGPCSGAATVIAIGGTAPISYNWVSPTSTLSTISGLCAGVHFLQMTDVQGCIRTTSVNINAAPQITITPTVNAPSCGIPNGTISIVVSPTVIGGYLYSWVPGPNLGPTYSNIGAGNYSVTVTDPNNNQCPKTQAFAINNTNGPVITYTQSNIVCSGALTGSITALGTSTSNPVSYAWSNGGTLPTVSGLGAGVITLTVTSANGCKTIQSFTLTQNQPLQLSLTNVTQPKCHNDCNGAITLVPSGGTLPYTFTWSPLGGSTNPQFSLCPGPSTAAIVYSATVTDVNGCVITASTSLINPASIVLTPTITNSSCSSIADGSLNIGVIGGTPVYTYTWTGPSSFTASSQNINSILAGTYSLSLTDKNGCKKDTTLMVVPTISIVALAGNDQTVCPTPSVTLTGTNSFGAVSYDWFLLPNITNSVSNSSTYFAPTPPTAPGSYTYALVALSPVGGCSDTDFVVVNTFGLPPVDAGPTYTIPVFTSVTIGGSPTTSGSVSISWSPSFNLDDPSIQNPVASNTLNTTYTVTIIDLITGCTSSDTMTVFLYPTIKIPNGFSPNGDSKNDRWIIDNLDQFPDNTVEIYNRWGEQLFFYKDYMGQFDGKYKGKDLPVGTYYYVINLNHPAYKTPYIGPLTIFR